MPVPPGSTDENQISSPSKSLLKRIDIGLMTGLCALLISFVGILTSRATFKMNQETQKARVLPIVDIDMGYLRKPDAKGELKQHFEVTLNNVGAGIAHVQRVTPLQNNKPLAEYKDFELAIMTGRMLSWSSLTEKPAAGFLRAGSSVTPVSYRLGGGERDLSAYLRGEWGKPMDGVDVEVCYCSVFEDCWTVKYLDNKLPQYVNSCGIEDAPIDQFQTYIEQRAKARQDN